MSGLPAPLPPLFASRFIFAGAAAGLPGPATTPATARASFGVSPLRSGLSRRGLAHWGGHGRAGHRARRPGPGQAAGRLFAFQAIPPPGFTGIPADLPACLPGIVSQYMRLRSIPAVRPRWPCRHITPPPQAIAPGRSQAIFGAFPGSAFRFPAQLASGSPYFARPVAFLLFRHHRASGHRTPASARPGTWAVRLATASPGHRLPAAGSIGSGSPGRRFRLPAAAALPAGRCRLPPQRRARQSAFCRRPHSCPPLPASSATPFSPIPALPLSAAPGIILSSARHPHRVGCFPAWAFRCVSSPGAWASAAAFTRASRSSAHRAAGPFCRLAISGRAARPLSFPPGCCLLFPPPPAPILFCPLFRYRIVRYQFAFVVWHRQSHWGRAFAVSAPARASGHPAGRAPAWAHRAAPQRHRSRAGHLLRIRVFGRRLISSLPAGSTINNFQALARLLLLASPAAQAPLIAFTPRRSRLVQFRCSCSSNFPPRSFPAVSFAHSDSLHSGCSGLYSISGFQAFPAPGSRAGPGREHRPGAGRHRGQPRRLGTGHRDVPARAWALRAWAAGLPQRPGASVSGLRPGTFGLCWFGFPATGPASAAGAAGLQRRAGLIPLIPATGATGPAPGSRFISFVSGYSGFYLLPSAALFPDSPLPSGFRLYPAPAARYSDPSLGQALPQAGFRLSIGPHQHQPPDGHFRLPGGPARGSAALPFRPVAAGTTVYAPAVNCCPPGLAITGV